MFVSIVIFLPVTALCIFMMMQWMYRMGMHVNSEYNHFGYFLIVWTLARATVGKKRIRGIPSCSNCKKTFQDATAPRLPAIPAVRLCFGIWNLVCVIICCFYQTTVTSFLSEPGFIKQITTIDDILNSNHEILVSAV